MTHVMGDIMLKSTPTLKRLNRVLHYTCHLFSRLGTIFILFLYVRRAKQLTFCSIFTSAENPFREPRIVVHYLRLYYNGGRAPWGGPKGWKGSGSTVQLMDTSGNHCKVRGKFRAILPLYTVSGMGKARGRIILYHSKGNNMRIWGGLRRYFEVVKRPQELFVFPSY